MLDEPANAGQTHEAVSHDVRALQAAEVDASQGDGTGQAKRARSRDGKNIIFRVFPEEHAEIAARAAEAGLSISEFIRRVVTGHETQLRFDYDVIEHLIRMHTDMNRLGNLFKLSLKQDGDGPAGTPLSYVERERHRSLLKSIEDNQELLRNYNGEFST